MNANQHAEVMVHELVHISERNSGLMNFAMRFGEHSNITGDPGTVLLYAAEFNAFRRTARYVRKNGVENAFHSIVANKTDSGILEEIRKAYGLPKLSLNDADLIVNSFYDLYRNSIR